MTAVRLILDTTAILGYARGVLDVGETIEQVVDEAAQFVLPSPCLVEAATMAPGAGLDLIDLLVKHGHALVWPFPDRWRSFADAVRVFGTWGRAAAVTVFAACPDAYVLTGESHVYDGAAATIGF